jgi:hypothetical protein
MLTCITRIWEWYCFTTLHSYVIVYIKVSRCYHNLSVFHNSICISPDFSRRIAFLVDSLGQRNIYRINETHDATYLQGKSSVQFVCHGSTDVRR